ALVEILTQPKNALVKQYQKLFEMDGVNLRFGKGALIKVANMAASHKTGARGLRAILEAALLDIMFDTPGQSVSELIINDDVVENPASPLITSRKKQTAAEVRPPLAALGRVPEVAELGLELGAGGYAVACCAAGCCAAVRASGASHASSNACCLNRSCC